MSERSPWVVAMAVHLLALRGAPWQVPHEHFVFASHTSHSDSAVLSTKGKSRMEVDFHETFSVRCRPTWRNVAGESVPLKSSFGGMTLLCLSRPHNCVWAFTCPACFLVFQAAQKPHVPYHVQHSGASNDVAMKRRSLADVQARGWCECPNDLQRYEKHARLGATWQS